MHTFVLHSSGQISYVTGPPSKSLMVVGGATPGMSGAHKMTQIKFHLGDVSMIIRAHRK